MVFELRYELPYQNKASDKFLDGDLRLVTLLDQSPEPSLPFPGASGSMMLQLGRAVDPTYVPRTAQVSGGQRAVTDYAGWRKLIYVSSLFKAIIEELEPEHHQFLPLRLVDKRRKHLADHWIWNVCNRIDSLDRERTTLILWKERLWRFPRDLAADNLPPGYVSNQPVKKVFNLSQIAGAHFWYDKFYSLGGPFCSHEARDAIAEAELSGINLKWQETA